VPPPAASVASCSGRVCFRQLPPPAPVAGTLAAAPASPSCCFDLHYHSRLHYCSHLHIPDIIFEREREDLRHRLQW
jgi:hypothetical protein